MRAAQRPLSWVASVLYLAVLATGLYFDIAGLCPAMTGHAATVGFAATLGILLGLEILERRLGPRPSRRTGVALLVIRMALFEVVALLDCSGFSSALTLLVPFTAYFLLGRRVSVALAVGYLAVTVVRLSSVPGWYQNPEIVSDLLMYFIGLVFAVSMAAVAAEADASRRRLAAYAERVAELAAATERNRLARDIHDSLGHHLTAIAVQLEKASAFRHRDESASEQALADARRSARYALEDVRASVGALRGPPAFSLASALAGLVEGVRDAELAVELELTGDESRFDGPTLLALYRAAQEGLTNVRRHAAARRVALTVHLDPGGASLLIADDGRGFVPSSVGSGFGLRGMRERLELVGGTLHVDAAPDEGTRLRVTIPSPAVSLTGVGS